MSRIRTHLTYANVVATVCLFLVLGGGTALASYAVSSNGQVGPGTISGHKPPSGDHANIIGGSVNATDLAGGAATLGKLASNSVNSAKVVNGSLTGDDLANNTIPGSKLGTFPSASVRTPWRASGPNSGCDVRDCGLPNDTDTPLCWYSTRFDTAGLAQGDCVLLPDHLTAPVAGTYVVDGQFSWDSNGAGDRRITIHQADSSGNNSQQIAADEVQPVAASGKWTQQNVGAIVRLNAGDQVSMNVYQNSGGTLKGEDGGLQIAWIGP
jgi:hypothetical protein